MSDNNRITKNEAQGANGPSSLPAADDVGFNGIYWVSILAILLLGFNVMSHLADNIGDEAVHSFQIHWFLKGQFEHFEHVTMLPIYHAMSAALLKLFSLDSINGFRFVNLLLGLGVVPMFYFLCRSVRGSEGQKFCETRTFLFLTIPFLFPLFFLVYTDLLSLAAILATIERTWKRHYFWAALLALFAILVRQTNVVWVAFACVLVALQELDLARGWWRDRSKILTELKRYCYEIKYFIAVGVVFLLFVVFNGGVAMGDVQQHNISFNISNLYFFLIVCFVIFLPIIFDRFTQVLRFVLLHKWILLIFVVGFFVYDATYEHPHKYNTKELAFYRHNLFIYYTCDIAIIRYLSWAAIFWTGLTLVQAALISEHRNSFLAMLIFACLSFVPLPLIEQRYYFVALCLLLVFLPKTRPLTMWIQMAYFVAACAYIMFNISRMNFFL